MKIQLQNSKECFLCKTTSNLERHHIFGGANRDISEKYNCCVWLCHKHHNEPPEGVHHNRAYDLMLKQIAEEELERAFGEERFRKEFGKCWK